jgi:hypothetical protein
MSTHTAAAAPLKLQDLMARWGVSEEVIKEHIRRNGLPFWDAGCGKGRKPEYRFRLADVEAWEAARVRTRADRSPAPNVPAPTTWDGKFRASKNKKPKAKGAQS